MCPHLQSPHDLHVASRKTLPLNRFQWHHLHVKFREISSLSIYNTDVSNSYVNQGPFYEANSC